MEKLKINTPQNVNIEYSLASVGSRIIAFALDYAILISYGFLVFYFLFKVLQLNQFRDPWFTTGVFTFLLLPVFFYHIFMETIMNGQTLGKKAMQIKVVKVDGTRATIYEYFIRWIFNLVDIWMLSGVVGLVAALLSENTQRVGDMAGGTTVISLKPKMNLVETIYEELEDKYELTYPQVVNFTDKDMNIIKRTLQKGIAKKDDKVLQALATQLKKVMEIEHIKTDEQIFIQTVIQDHYEYFRTK